MNTISIDCPDEGTLRAFHDHEAPNHDAIAEHVRSCLTCARSMRELRAAAMVTGDALAVLDTDRVEALPRTHRGDGIGHVTAIDPPRRRHTRGIAVAASAAVLAGAVVVTPAGRSMAAGLLSNFRSHEVVGVTVSRSDAEQAAGVLSSLGSSSNDVNSVEPQRVSSVAAAQKLVGFRIAQPTAQQLPSGLPNTPVATVTKRQQATFTFSEAKTKAYLKESGSNLAIPAGFDGEKLTLTFPSAVALSYGDESKGKRLIVGTAEPIAASTTGSLSLEQLRAFLLEVPGVPKSLVNQLGGMDIQQGALPIPIPVDYVQGENTTLADHPAVQMSQTGLGSGVIWQEDQRIVGVAGTYDLDQMKALATQLAGH